MAKNQDFPTETVAKRVRKLRGKMTAEQLAEKMREVGVPFDKTVVANLETGRRRFVTVQELLALAYVLNVAPAALLVDPEAENLSDYQVTPAVTAGTAATRMMIDGRWPLPGMDPWTYFREMPEGERLSDDELTSAIATHQRGMRPVVPGDEPRRNRGQRQ